MNPITYVMKIHWKRNKVKMEEAWAKTLEDQKNEAIQRQAYQSSIDANDAAMFSKYCPVTGKTCIVDCIHFKQGFVFDTGDWMKAVFSRCKLWRS